MKKYLFLITLLAGCFSCIDYPQDLNLERPQLLLDKDGNPIVFYGACAINSPFDKKNHGTFNVHIPLLSGGGE